MTPLAIFHLVSMLGASSEQTTSPAQPPASIQSGRRWYHVREATRFCGGTERILHPRRLSEDMSLKLSTERSTYYVGEPIRLALTLRNESDRPLRGNFKLSARCGFAQMYYRRTPNEFRELLRPDPFRIPQADGTDVEAIPFTVAHARSLKSGEEVVAYVTYAFEPVSGRFVFDAPGRYEFKVIYADVRDSPNAVLSSEPLSVRVEPLPMKEEGALAAYSRGELAPLAQYDPVDSPELPTRITKEASVFLERHSDSVYVEYVKKGLFLALKTRIRDDRATPEERGVFEKLRAEGVGQENQEPIDPED